MQVKAILNFAGQPDEVQKYGGLNGDSSDYDFKIHPHRKSMIYRGTIMEVSEERAADLIQKGLAEAVNEQL